MRRHILQLLFQVVPVTQSAGMADKTEWKILGKRGDGGDLVVVVAVLMDILVDDYLVWSLVWGNYSSKLNKTHSNQFYRKIGEEDLLRRYNSIYNIR
jgi:hypothetical protein